MAIERKIEKLDFEKVWLMFQKTKEMLAKSSLETDKKLRKLETLFTSYKFMKIYIIILAIIFSTTSIFSQNTNRKPLVAYYHNNFWHILDTEGKQIFKPIKFESLIGYSEGFFAIRKAIGKDTVLGYMNLQGQFATIPNVQWISLFKNNIAIYATWQPGLEEVKYFGYIRNDGTILTQPVFLEATEFNDGLAFVMNQKSRGYIDTTGKFVKEFKVGFGEIFSNNLAVVQDTSSHFGYLDKNFNIKLPIIYDYAHNFHNGYARVVKGASYGYIDTNGKEFIPTVFEMASDFNNGRAFISNSREMDNTKWAIITTGGKILSDYIYSEITDYSEGTAAVSIDSTWFYIDQNGDKIFENEYDFCSSYIDGIAYARVKTQGSDFRHGFIDFSGEFLLNIPKEAEVVVDLRTNKLMYKKNAKVKSTENK